jgi:nucleosome assembly protein 1-like 1
MSSNVPISQGAGITAPTPQNTPLQHAPISSGLSRPTVPDIAEEDKDGDAEEEEGDGVGDALHNAMLGMVQGRLQGLLGKSSGYIESLPTEVKLSIEGLKGIQVEHTKLQNQYKRECLELEKKYLQLQQPLFDRRKAIISGSAKPTEEEILAGEAQSAKDDEDFTPLPKETDFASTAAAIPEFWLTALRNSIGLSDLITDRDASALKHLTNISLAYLSEDKDKDQATGAKPGFTLLFEFSPNEFFENEVLSKTYVYQEEVGYSGDFVYDRAIGTEIKWKDDKDLTKEYEVKKQRNKTTNRTRFVKKAHPTESFFNFFTPPQLPSDDVIEAGEIDPEELEEIEEKLELDYQIGEDLKEKIIPRAVDYFTGKALEYEIVEDGDDSDLDLDDDDEDDFEDDSDSDNDVPVSKRRGGKRGGNQNVNPEECKQQ